MIKKNIHSVRNVGASFFAMLFVTAVALFGNQQIAYAQPFVTPLQNIASVQTNVIQQQGITYAKANFTPVQYYYGPSQYYAPSQYSVPDQAATNTCVVDSDDAVYNPSTNTLTNKVDGDADDATGPTGAIINKDDCTFDQTTGTYVYKSDNDADDGAAPVYYYNQNVYPSDDTVYYDGDNGFPGNGYMNGFPAWKVDGLTQKQIKQLIKQGDGHLNAQTLKNFCKINNLPQKLCK